MPTMKEINESWPGFYKLEDFSDGTERVLTIKSAGYEEVGPEKRDTFLLKFEENRKILAINGCRHDQLNELFPDGGEIIGNKIKLSYDPAVKASNGKTGPQIVISAP